MKKVSRLVFGSYTPSLPSDIALTIMRVVAGLSMAFAHGIKKTPPPEAFIGGVEALGFPLPTFFAWAAALSELVGGILLAMGLLTRPAALMVAATVGVAFFIRHGQDPFGDKELALTYLIISITFVINGSGRFGLDRFLRGRA